MYLAGPVMKFVHSRFAALSFSSEKDALQHLKENAEFIKSLTIKDVKTHEPTTWELKKYYTI